MFNDSRKHRENCEVYLEFRRYPKVNKNDVRIIGGNRNWTLPWKQVGQARENLEAGFLRVDERNERAMRANDIS